MRPNKYQPYVMIEKGKPVLYVELVKALYGTIHAALIFWRKFTKQLIDWGFTVNPYDWCVANKLVQGSQLIITWHVDGNIPNTVYSATLARCEC